MTVTSQVRQRLKSDVFITRVEVWGLGRLRRLSGRDTCTILAAHGFAEVRQRGCSVEPKAQPRPSPFPTTAS